ncbi:MAG: hypothetical protein OXF79_29175 [Chloroflexi bacterium]|nr:hypothetical protein [Chloroflexota bacterium]
MAASPVNEHIRYEPDEHPPALLTIGAGFQAALLIVGGIVLGVVIVFRIADQPASYIAWGVFAALLISGITTILQSARLWRIGAGHILMMGTSGAFFAVCVAALIQGGPALMASLVVVSALFQFALAARLSVLRSVFTPVVSGTVIMLIAATIMPIVFDMLSDAPEGTASMAPPLVAAVTILVVVVLVLRAPASLRLWSPVAGIVVGCAVSAPFGMYDVQYVKDAPWFGVPFSAWPRFDFTPGVEFWALLPAFIVVTIVGAIETIGDGVAIQRVSRRRPQATDYRVVQGALNTDGVGNLLSGLAGTLPNTTYSTSISLAEVTGIAARRVGIVVGVIFIILAFFPKATALLIAIPSPVAAAYVGLLIALLFVQGLRIIVQDGLDHRKATVAGVAFWTGVGFQNGVIFPDLLGEGFLGVLLGNGMTSGAIVAVALMAFVEFSKPRRRRLRVPMNDDTAQQVDDFLRAFASRINWNGDAADRLAAAGEETLVILSQSDDDSEPDDSPRRLAVSARREGNNVDLEFISSLEGENVEDRLTYLSALPTVPDDGEVSYRLLRHYASSVRHQKYHGLDVVTVSVAAA